jgi:hypothetical protein
MSRMLMFFGGRHRFLLDEVPNAQFGYALVKLRTAYSGNCIEVRRSSDNTTQNIGFVNNRLDIASLLSFVGVGNGFIRTWYDQTSNGYNATQTTTTNQQQIVASGVYLGHLLFDGSNDFLDITASGALNVFRNVNYGSVFGTVKLSDTSTIGNLFFAGINTIGSIGRLRLDANFTANPNRYRIGARRLDGDATQSFISNADHNTNEAVISVLADWGNSDLLMYENGIETINDTSFLTNGNTSNTASAQVRIGVNGNGSQFFFGQMKNLIVYNTEQSANRLLIEQILNTYK